MLCGSVPDINDSEETERFQAGAPSLQGVPCLGLLGHLILLKYSRHALLVSPRLVQYWFVPSSRITLISLSRKPPEDSTISVSPVCLVTLYCIALVKDCIECELVPIATVCCSMLYMPLPRGPNSTVRCPSIWLSALSCFAGMAAFCLFHSIDFWASDFHVPKSRGSVEMQPAPMITHPKTSINLLIIFLTQHLFWLLTGLPESCPATTVDAHFRPGTSRTEKSVEGVPRNVKGFP